MSTMATMDTIASAKMSHPRYMILLALACSYSATNSCIGFCPVEVVPSGTARYRNRRPHSHATAAPGWSTITIMLSPSTPSRSRRRRRQRQTRSELYGYANVNDYFASFNTTIGNSGDEKQDSASATNSTSTIGATRKYIGHGRVVDDRSSNEGGLFDVNNYFTSFNENSNNNNTSNDDEDKIAREKATSTTSDDTTEPNRKQQPPQTTMRKMTYQEIVASNNARLCPKLLLTQRAIQSFVYLLEECRDPHSGKWIEDFLGMQNLGNYHGNGAFNTTKYPTWDSVLYDMMNQPNTHVTVSAKRRGRGHGGWSKNNPFLEERYVEFKIDVRPASLVQRLLSVRGQLASEFERDLDIITMVDDRIMNSYFDKLRTSSSSSSSSSSSEKQGKDRRAPGADTASSSSSTRPKSSAFDRISIDILTNFTEAQETCSSPFRRGNFDLLYSLSTHASAHRLLRELHQSVSSSSILSTSSKSSDDIMYQWFKRFYTERVSEYFDGDQPFGRGDDFIDALLTTPPSLVEMSDGVTIGLTDPLSIAERIIEIRSVVAQEWKSMMRDEVKNDHLRMNDVLFRVMMGRTMDESGGDGVAGEIQEETTTEVLANTTGAFE